MDTLISPMAKYMDFPFLVDGNSVCYIANSKCMFILRGAPGSGKTSIAKHIIARYSSAPTCDVGRNSHQLEAVRYASADDYFTTPDGSYDFSAERLGEAHALCQKRVEDACFRDMSVIVVDNTNIRLWEMAVYLGMARHFGYRVMIVEPRTPWRQDAAILAGRCSHSVPQAAIERKLNTYEIAIPLYFAWFPRSDEAKQLHDYSAGVLEQCWKDCEQFRKWFIHCSANTSANEVDVQLYYYGSLRTKPKANIADLHVTSMFCGHDYQQRALQYTTSPIVTHSLGKVFPLEVVGFVITQDTLGARVRLSPQSLDLWNQDDNYNVMKIGDVNKCAGGGVTDSRKQFSYLRMIAVFLYTCPSRIWTWIYRVVRYVCGKACGIFVGTNKRPLVESGATMAVAPQQPLSTYACPRGSRAHITLGYSDQSRPVQTGLDILRVVMCEVERVPCHEYGLQHPHSATLRCYNNTTWAVDLPHPIIINCLFTGCY